MVHFVIRCVESEAEEEEDERRIAWELRCINLRHIVLHRWSSTFAIQSAFTVHLYALREQVWLA